LQAPAGQMLAIRRRSTLAAYDPACSHRGGADVVGDAEHPDVGVDVEPSGADHQRYHVAQVRAAVAVETGGEGQGVGGDDGAVHGQVAVGLVVEGGLSDHGRGVVDRHPQADRPGGHAVGVGVPGFGHQLRGGRVGAAVVADRPPEVAVGARVDLAGQSRHRRPVHQGQVGALHPLVGVEEAQGVGGAVQAGGQHVVVESVDDGGQLAEQGGDIGGGVVVADPRLSGLRGTGGAVGVDQGHREGHDRAGRHGRTVDRYDVVGLAHQVGHNVILVDVVVGQGVGEQPAGEHAGIVVGGHGQQVGFFADGVRGLRDHPPEHGPVGAGGVIPPPGHHVLLQFGDKRGLVGAAVDGEIELGRGVPGPGQFAVGGVGQGRQRRLVGGQAGREIPGVQGHPPAASPGRYRVGAGRGPPVRRVGVLEVADGGATGRPGHDR